MLAAGTFVLLGESARDPSVPSPWAARRRRRRTGAGACRRVRRRPARRRPDRSLHGRRHAPARRRRCGPRHRPAGRPGHRRVRRDDRTPTEPPSCPGSPLETGEGPAVVLDVAADKEATFTDDESGCTFIDTWHAERLAVAVDAPAVEVAFAPEEQLADSSIDCPPAEPEPTGAGRRRRRDAETRSKATLPATDALARRDPAACRRAHRRRRPGRRVRSAAAPGPAPAPGHLSRRSPPRADG